MIDLPTAKFHHKSRPKWAATAGFHTGANLQPSLSFGELIGSATHLAIWLFVLWLFWLGSREDLDLRTNLKDCCGGYLLGRVAFSKHWRRRGSWEVRTLWIHNLVGWSTWLGRDALHPFWLHWSQAKMETKGTDHDRSDLFGALWAIKSSLFETLAVGISPALIAFFIWPLKYLKVFEVFESLWRSLK